MNGRTITIGGPPGSGKSTLAKALAKILKREYTSAGDVFRAEAARRKLTLAQFGALAEKDERIDLALDEQMVGLAGPAHLLDGRIIGELLVRRRIPAYRILVVADEKVRAQRITGRDGGIYEEVLEAMHVREASETHRYLKYYGIDLGSQGKDLEIDSSNLDQGQVLLRVLENLPEDLREQG